MGWGRRYCCLCSNQGKISLLGRVGWGEMKGGVGRDEGWGGEDNIVAFALIRVTYVFWDGWGGQR